ncbi:MAG: hypothetical protein IJZ79_02795 [Bacilli bacterium]|nr:hypothetical protein [Bacilli bacterium]MBQ8218653.1 hypothetical protein [Bacilli bacterium]
MKIKWINKYSNESGFVKHVDYKKHHFVNTFNESEAKKYASEESAKKTIAKLIEYGEGENNNFIIVA